MKRPVVIALLALCGLSCGCRDRFDVPDTPADAPAANITIASLHAFLHAETVVVREELTVSGTVVSSDEAGNFYRTLVLDDGTGGAELRIAEYNLYTRCVQPLPDRLHLLARAARTAAASYGRTAGTRRYTVRNRTTRHGVVRPSGSYRRPAVPPRRGKQAVPQTWEGYRLFEDAAGRTIVVYTSAYARFADREIPAGECSLTGVLEYGTAGSYGKQFILQMRDENDCTH